MSRILLVVACFLLACVGCSSAPPVITEDMLSIEDGMPVDLSGSWARDYARSDTVNDVLRKTYFELAGGRSGPGRGGYRGPDTILRADRDMQDILPLARLAELITRPDELTISQTENEIRIERRDDFAIACSFYNGRSRDTGSPYGREICGWSGDRLVSHLALPDGLEVTHRFTMSDDRQSLRVMTTVASDTARVPFTLSHYYWKFQKPAPKYQCIETLSMKRVCSTGELAP